MSRLLIVCEGESPQAQAQRRGKLFERLMADVLRKYGFKIDRIPSTNYAGMEIDIEGTAIATGIPLYAECKYYDTEVNSPKFQAFFGNYMTRFWQDKRCQGLFIAVPGVNSYAKGYYREHCESSNEFTVRLLEEDAVLQAVIETNNLPDSSVIERFVSARFGRIGDRQLLHTDFGFFWIQLIVTEGSTVADSYLIFTDRAEPVTQPQVLDRLMRLYPELLELRRLSADVADKPSLPVSSSREQPPDEVVEVRGGSSWFEYQFPASPEHFVGRREVLADVRSFVLDVLAKKVSARGILFEANSGWGKSSLVLAATKHLVDEGHYAVAIDCRSISTTSSILRAVDYALVKFSSRPELFKHEPITGFDGAARLLADFGKELESESKVAVIFLDQFENLFFLPDVLRRVRDLLLSVCGAQSNVIFGFSWKTDLVGTTSEFPYQLRDSIADASKHLFLRTFSDVETNTLLDELQRELHTKLRKDLRFFLSEFSQGYPWLLKKLCAHVKAQRDEGVLQAEIANRLLNIEELFQEDLSGLSAEQQDVLYRISKAAPVSISELGDQFRPEVVQALVHRRLVVRVGHRYDIYWDIFRDYLNTKKVPAQENYVLRVAFAPVLKATKLLVESGGIIKFEGFRRASNLSENSAYNVVRDLRLLGLASVMEGDVRLSLKIPPSAGEKVVVDEVRRHLHEHLVRNRVVSRILETMESTTAITIEELAQHLSSWCPYVSATDATWRMYATIFASWLDLADLAIYDNREKTLNYFKPGSQLRERDVSIPKRRKGLLVPAIQYTPVERIAISIFSALSGQRVDWSDMKRTTRAKSFGMLEDLGFLHRVQRGYAATPALNKDFVENATYRQQAFAQSVLRIPSFYSFLQILKAHETKKTTVRGLALELRETLRTDWKEGTAITNTKIMLDWARHTGLAPGVFAREL